MARMRRELLQDGQSKRGRLPRPGLRTGHQVAPAEHQRDRLGLNRGRLFVPLLAHGGDEGRYQAELFKCRLDKGRLRVCCENPEL